ncbi:MAG: cytochrome c biogenesis protein CcsA [Desulfovibrio sp.]|jgi:cytochrome c-type biogenesis protein CcmF|nr:cytochrome c biogenesis protein CcsA [Desulfovibrio sp.]
MYFFANVMQVLALLCALVCGCTALYALLGGKRSFASATNDDAWARQLEKGHWIVTGALLLASALLLHALYWRDYSLQYVASYTDNILPEFYRLTAFWAGQPGSMLFWALAVSVSGSLFARTRACKTLRPAVRLWYWAFFYAIMAFFTLVLTVWSNPFVTHSPVPADGNGLNPLLQNPGMIFHPPLLFLGYGGFTVPACLALAQTLAGRDDQSEVPWFRLARPFMLTAWIFLTAGIVLGAWWAYMELGWGGYWAWDPVENASLIPWLVGTASLHTLIVEERRDKLRRVNVCMMALTTISAFFATYIVRSGVIESVHAFGDSPVGVPLLVFIVVALVVAFLTAAFAPRAGKPLAALESREGMLTLVAWILLALAAIILLATMWPVLSALWMDAPRGLDAAFYNRVCLPLGAALMLFMAVCPWFAWDGGLRRKKIFLAAAGVFVIAAASLWNLGYRQFTPQITAAASITIIFGVLLLLKEHGFRRPVFLGAWGAHLGMALMALGIAFSGPYAEEQDMMLARGESGKIGEYTATLQEITGGRATGYEFITGRLQISKNDEMVGVVAPQRRIYDKFGTMQFSEVDVIPSLGDEIYASLLGLDNDMRVMVRVSVKPLVNWLWIGGTLLCLFPLVSLFGRGRTAAAAEKAVEAAVEEIASKAAPVRKIRRKRRK